MPMPKGYHNGIWSRPYDVNTARQGSFKSAHRLAVLPRRRFMPSSLDRLAG